MPNNSMRRPDVVVFVATQAIAMLEINIPEWTDNKRTQSGIFCHCQRKGKQGDDGRLEHQRQEHNWRRRRIMEPKGAKM